MNALKDSTKSLMPEMKTGSVIKLGGDKKRPALKCQIVREDVLGDISKLLYRVSVSVFLNPIRRRTRS